MNHQKVLVVAASLFAVFWGKDILAQSGGETASLEVQQETTAEKPVAAYNLLRGGENFFYIADPRFRTTEKANASKAMLGVHVRPADATLRQHLGLEGDFGLVVEHVTDASAAEEAGVKQHDVLVKFEGQLLVNLDQLQSLIAMHQPGDTVKVQYFRTGKIAELEVKLSKQTTATVGAMSKELEKVHQDLVMNPHGQQARNWKMRDCQSCHKVTSNSKTDFLDSTLSISDFLRSEK